MKALANVSLLLRIGTLVVSLGIFGTWMIAKFTTDHLLYQNATSTAQGWARYLAESVADLEQIAAGEQPSAASMAFFQRTKPARCSAP